MKRMLLTALFLSVTASPALCADLDLPIGYASSVTCSPDSEVDGACTFELQPGGETYVSLDVLGPFAARITGLAAGEAVLEVSADRLLGPGELILTETYSIEAYPFASTLGVTFGEPAPPE